MAGSAFRASVPMRTCVGCRAREAKSELLRVVGIRHDGVTTVLPDPRGALPGRGASLHPVLACYELAERRRAFSRALRLEGPIDPTPVGAWLRQLDPGAAAPVRTTPVHA